MSKTKTIKLMNLETLNIVAWYKDFSEKKRNKVLPVRIQFDLQRNIMKLAEAAQSLEKFREELVKDIQEEFFGNDEKSYEAIAFFKLKAESGTKRMILRHPHYCMSDVTFSLPD